MSDTNITLSQLYNTIEISMQTYQNYATNSLDLLSRTVAQAKVDALSDVLLQILQLIQED